MRYFIICIAIIFCSKISFSNQLPVFFGIEIGKKLPDERIIHSYGILGEEWYIPSDFENYYRSFHEFKIVRDEDKIVKKIIATNLQSYLCIEKHMSQYANIFKKKYKFKEEVIVEQYGHIENNLYFYDIFNIRLNCSKAGNRFWIEILLQK